MRNSRLLALTLLTLVVLGLVPSAEPSAQAQRPTMAGYPALGAPAIVTLLSPGAAPRTTLRYAVPANTRARMNMTTNMSMTMGMAGMPLPAMSLPAMKMAIDVAVTSVAPNGDITYDLAFASATAEAAAGTDPMVAAAMQTGLAGLSAVKGTATVTDRGVIRKVALNLDAVVDPQVRQAMQSMTSSIENVAMPLPVDAVGVGARWEVRSALSSGGTDSFQKAEYEIVSIAGNVVTMKVKCEQTAPPQAVSNPALPPGTDVQLEKLTGSGTGTVVIRLDSLVPTSDMQSTLSTVMAMSLGGQSQQISVDLAMKIAIARDK